MGKQFLCWDPRNHGLAFSVFTDKGAVVGCLAQMSRKGLSWRCVLAVCPKPRAVPALTDLHLRSHLCVIVRRSHEVVSLK